MITTYFANVIMGNVFGTKTNISFPSNFYIGLSKAAPNKDGTGCVEPSGGSYARQVLNTTNLSVPGNGIITNTAMIEYPPTTDDWSSAAAPITHYVVFDAATGGNLLFGEQLAKSRIVQDGSQLSFAAGELKFILQDVEAE